MLELVDFLDFLFQILQGRQGNALKDEQTSTALSEGFGDVLTCLIIASFQRWNSSSEISLFETYSSRKMRSLLPCLQRKDEH